MIPAGAYGKSIAHFLAPVRDLLCDPAVSEILVNGASEIWAERAGKLVRTECTFASRAALDAALTNIAQCAGRRFDAGAPILEAHLPDGSRVEAVMPPLAENGPVVAIRRFSASAMTLADLARLGAITREAALFLRRCVSNRRNIVVSGGTGSGKTSLLCALSGLLGDGERIVVIEDTRELRLQNPHVVYLETRSADEQGQGKVTVRDLLRATLRLRPDRIVVGEVRGGEALDLIQAMTSGHGGSMTTVHAKSPLDALRRIETMAAMHEEPLPLHALRSQTASAVDIVVQTARSRDGGRQVEEVAAVGNALAEEGYRIRPLFARDSRGALERIAKPGGKGT